MSEPTARDWEHFAALLFEYYDANEDFGEVEDAWHALTTAIEHWRALGSPEPQLYAEAGEDER